MPPLRCRTSSKTGLEHEARRLLAANAAGAEHRDLAMARGIERAAHPVREVAEIVFAWIDSPLEGAKATSKALRVSISSTSGSVMTASSRRARHRRRRADAESTARSPIVTVSFLIRTFSRLKGGASAWDRRGSRPERPAAAQIESRRATIAAGGAASVPFRPSGARSRMPRAPAASQSAFRRSRRTPSSQRLEAVKGGDRPLRLGTRHRGRDSARGQALSRSGRR